MRGERGAEWARAAAEEAAAADWGRAGLGVAAAAGRRGSEAVSSSAGSLW